MPEPRQEIRTTPGRWLAFAVVLGFSSLTVGATSMEQAEVQAAMADLATRQSVAIEDISVYAREEVTWPDGSLGCPRPGMAYKQQTVNGSRLILQVGDRRYAYHAGPSGSYRFCEHPAAVRSSAPDDSLI